MATLRVVKAKHGDSLLLLGDQATVLIDGGPSGVYNQTLREVLSRLEGENDEPPRIDLLIVSHIDADHIDGVLDLTAELLEAREEERDPIVRIDRAWHNSFADALAKKGALASSTVKASAASVAEGFSRLGGSGFDAHQSRLVLSSVSQGRQLRLDLKALNVDLNQRFGNRLALRDPAVRPWTKGDLTLRVVGPTQAEVDALRKVWAEELPAILAKEGAASEASAARLDTSVSNLASIVAIAESGGKQALLTGDARGDRILEWLEATGDLEAGKSVHFHIVKLPHHGSDHNVDAEFFERVTADHYVISGNGGHGNPEPATLEMLFSARPELRYTVHMTYGPDELAKRKAFEKAGNPAKLDAVLSDAARKDRLRFPKPDQTFLDIDF